MMLEEIVASAPMFLLVAVRCFGMIMTMPLLSGRNVSRIAKVALTGYMAYLIYPQLSVTGEIYSTYYQFINPDGSFSLEYILLLLGEGLIGVILGFYLNMIFSAMSTAGQFFAFQMGFSASEVYDALSQVENPLMGQFLNYVALLVFLTNGWFQRLFLDGLLASFHSISALSIVNNNGALLNFMLVGLSKLFANAMLVALPIVASLFLINAAVGILSKAAPQMNMLSEGFPILMLTAFFLICSILPQMVNLFTRSFYEGFKEIERLFIDLGGKIG